MYQREVQNDCVFETVNNTRTSWCSLTNNYDRDRERRECWGNEGLIFNDLDFTFGTKVGLCRIYLLFIN